MALPEALLASLGEVPDRILAMRYAHPIYNVRGARSQRGIEAGPPASPLELTKAFIILWNRVDVSDELLRRASGFSRPYSEAKRLRELGWPLRMRKPSKEVEKTTYRVPITLDEVSIVARYHAGESIRDLAKAFGVSYETIRYRISKQTKLRPQGTRHPLEQSRRWLDA